MKTVLTATDIDPWLLLGLWMRTTYIGDYIIIVNHFTRSAVAYIEHLNQVKLPRGEIVSVWSGTSSIWWDISGFGVFQSLDTASWV